MSLLEFSRFPGSMPLDTAGILRQMPLSSETGPSTQGDTSSAQTNLIPRRGRQTSAVLSIPCQTSKSCRTKALRKDTMLSEYTLSCLTAQHSRDGEHRGAWIQTLNHNHLHETQRWRDLQFADDGGNSTAELFRREDFSRRVETSVYRTTTQGLQQNAPDDTEQTQAVLKIVDHLKNLEHWSPLYESERNWRTNSTWMESLCETMDFSGPSYQTDCRLLKNSSDRCD
ncbi:interferon regulatory factor 1a isoform X3 [Triplophysa rosa]|uniref:interferon regulatory factor 1a isoform X3 n=1 Tax=Triplophysa rosa TaxID=992332 RepID=UPI002545C659|nr:interferon regulatory factor 1a isoform X3 [Triplophysa rosa]